MSKPTNEKLGGVSNEAVEKATGHGWSQWLAILDKAGAGQRDHKEIVAYLKQTHGLSRWWQQTVTVGYEKSKGRRVVGQTADAGFQVGVQKTIPVDVETGWQLLTSRKGLACWLGKTVGFSLVEGATYKTDGGAHGEVRVVKPGSRIRLTWQSPDMKRPATLQISLVASGPEKTSFRIHLEKLASQKAREMMKEHWRDVLNRLAQLAHA